MARLSDEDRRVLADAKKPVVVAMGGGTGLCFRVTVGLTGTRPFSLSSPKGWWREKVTTRQHLNRHNLDSAERRCLEQSEAEFLTGAMGQARGGCGLHLGDLSREGRMRGQRYEASRSTTVLCVGGYRVGYMRAHLSLLEIPSSQIGELAPIAALVRPALPG